MVRQARQLPKFSDMLTHSQSGGRLCRTIGFASPKTFRDYAPASNLLTYLSNLLDVQSWFFCHFYLTSLLWSKKEARKKAKSSAAISRIFCHLLPFDEFFVLPFEHLKNFKKVFFDKEQSQLLFWSYIRDSYCCYNYNLPEEFCGHLLFFRLY